jgi:hypothetical protein
MATRKLIEKQRFVTETGAMLMERSMITGNLHSEFKCLTAM